MAFCNPGLPTYSALPSEEVSVAYFALYVPKSNPGDPLNCPDDLGYEMAFLLTNTSSTLLPGSPGGRKLWLFVF